MKLYHHFDTFNSLVADVFCQLDDDNRVSFCRDYLNIIRIIDSLKGYSYRLGVEIFNDPDIVESALESCLLYLDGDEYSGSFDLTFDEFCNLYKNYIYDMHDDILFVIFKKFGLNDSDNKILSDFFLKYYG